MKTVSGYGLDRRCRWRAKPVRETKEPQALTKDEGLISYNRQRIKHITSVNYLIQQVNGFLHHFLGKKYYPGGYIDYTKKAFGSATPVGKIPEIITFRH